MLGSARARRRRERLRRRLRERFDLALTHQNSMRVGRDAFARNLGARIDGLGTRSLPHRERDRDRERRGTHRHQTAPNVREAARALEEPQAKSILCEQGARERERATRCDDALARGARQIDELGLGIVRKIDVELRHEGRGLHRFCLRARRRDDRRKVRGNVAWCEASRPDDREGLRVRDRR